MIAILTAILGFTLFSVLHVSAMAICANALGIAIRDVSFGFGKKIGSLGRISLRSMPFGGFVEMKDSREETLGPDDTYDAFNHQPLWKQVAVPLSGSVSVLVLGLATLGSSGWSYFIAAFGQILYGAITPFSTAQEYLSSFEIFRSERGVVDSLALEAFKLAAVNLLPISTLNGGQVLMILAKGGRPSVSWENKITQWAFWPLLVFFFGWAFAFCYWVWRHAT